jgi:hypothetical protein
VVARLSDVCQTGRQSGKSFTTSYGAYDRAAWSLAYCNAACPAALLFAGPARESAALQQPDSTGPMVGMLPPEAP